MRTLLLAMLLAISNVAAANVVMRATDTNGDYIRLFSQPCSNTVILTQTPPQYRERMQVGEASIGGKVYAICWLMRPDAKVGMLYEDGDSGLLPVQVFKPEVNS
jgi:hypothetical protein